MRARVVAVVLLSGMLFGVSAIAGVVPGHAAEPGWPSRTAVLTATRTAAAYYRPTFGVTSLSPRNGWSWSTYAQGVLASFRVLGDQGYRDEGLGWGRTNAWGLSTERNPDNIKAGQVYSGWSTVDAAADLAAMDARMGADLTGLPSAQYDWADALFMGLADWQLWAARTGNDAYAARMDDFYTWMRDRGATSSRCGSRQPSQAGLYDASARLWYRDCTFVDARDANGKRVFWGRGNGWVAAAMAGVLETLPPDSPRATKYADMLVSMSSRLASLQGTDGMWRASLEDPALFPQPETSATALITYALASGVRMGVLDASTYRPVIARAWRGLTGIALQPSGFLTSCQPNGVAPAAPYTATAPRTAATATSSGTVNTDSPPFCVGAFLLAGTEISRLTPDLALGRPVTVTSEQSGTEGTRLVDGDVTTRWSASGFPQSATVDLGGVVRIGETSVTPYLDRSYRYRVEGSKDRVSWALLVDHTASPAPGTRLDSFAAGDYRYVRLVVTGVVGSSTTWVSIQELGVYPAADGQLFAGDSFERSVAGGLGSASVGGAWSLSGPASAFSVAGGEARLTTSAGQGVAGYLSGVTVADVDLAVTSAAATVPSGGPAYSAILVRRAGSNDYRLKLTRRSTGTTIALVRTVSGAETGMVTASLPSTIAPTDMLRLRLQAFANGSGTTLRARAWKVGTSEPTTWLLATADSTTALQGAGGVGIWAYLSGSATNGPVACRFDDLLATAPG